MGHGRIISQIGVIAYGRIATSLDLRYSHGIDIVGKRFGLGNLKCWPHQMMRAFNTVAMELKMPFIA